MSTGTKKKKEAGYEIFVENLKKLTKCQQRYGAEKINGPPQSIAGRTQKKKLA